VAQEKVYASVVLAGNPNSGKTSIFNALTGARQKVGNYPGVTVESKEGTYEQDGKCFQIWDLPGTYSLTSYSPEERIAREELVRKGVRVTVVVADSTNLQRNLYLLTQIMAIGANIVLALNMSDEAKQAGQVVDTGLMEKLLGFPVVETVGNRGKGIDGLKKAIEKAILMPNYESKLDLGESFYEAQNRLNEFLQNTNTYTNEWITLKALEGDNDTIQWIKKSVKQSEGMLAEVARIGAQIESNSGLPVNTYLADRQYGFIRGLLEETITRKPRKTARKTSDMVDKVLCNRVLGFPFFFTAMYGIFWLTFTIGELPMGWIESFFAWLSPLIQGLWPQDSESLLKSLIVDGIIAGVGGVLVFLPNIVLLFLGLALMEDTGYMARAAFLTDKFLHKFGLHGKSFVPLVTGFGCSVPGIMATRTIENEKDRLSTIMVLPLISCGARLPIWLLLIPAFFVKEIQATMLWLIYIMGIGLALVLAKLLRTTVLKGEEAPFVMELPPYRLPTFKAVTLKMMEKSWHYLKKAGTIILAISILMWAATSFPKKETYSVDSDTTNGTIQVVSEMETGLKRGESPGGIKRITQAELNNIRASEDLEYSLSGRIGKGLEPILAPLGFDWKIGTAIIGAFAAKEVFVAQMGIVYSIGEANEESKDLRGKLRSQYSPLVAFSLMLFLLISAPCMATIAVTMKETGSIKWAFLQLGGLTALAYFISLIFYQVGSFLMA